MFQLVFVACCLIAVRLQEESGFSCAVSSEQVVLGINKVPLKSSLLKAGRAQVPQPLHTGQVLQLSDRSGGPALDCLQHVHFFPVLGVPDWAQYSDAVCQGPGEGGGPVPWAGCYTHRGTAHAAGLVCCKGTLLLRVQVVVCQDPHHPFLRAALQAVSLQPVLFPQVIPSQT